MVGAYRNTRLRTCRLPIEGTCYPKCVVTGFVLGTALVSMGETHFVGTRVLTGNTGERTMQHLKINRSRLWRLAFGALLFAMAGAAYSGQFDFAKNSSASANATAAIAKYKPLAERGNAAAQFNMGMIYNEGYGVAADDAAAAVWFRKSAEQGFVRAQSNLGLLYLIGHGVPQDYDQAARWFTKAAQQGDSIAQENLGAMYAKGEGVPRDERLAIEWSQKAADQGNEKAKANLALLTRPRDEKIAYGVGYLLGFYGPIVLVAGFLLAGLWISFRPKRPPEVKTSRW